MLFKKFNIEVGWDINFTVLYRRVPPDEPLELQVYDNHVEWVRESLEQQVHDNHVEWVREPKEVQVHDNHAQQVRESLEEQVHDNHVGLACEQGEWVGVEDLGARHDPLEEGGRGDDGRGRDDVESHDRELWEEDGEVEGDDDDHGRRQQPEQQRLRWG